MKRISLSTFLLLTFFFAFSQGATVRNVKTNDSIEIKTQISILEGKVKKLQSQFEDIKKFKESQEDMVKQTTSTISMQNSLLNDFGHMFTLFTLLIAVLGIVIPWLATWLLAIKPAKHEIKELQNVIDKKVADYLETERIKKIDRFAKDLNNNDKDLKDAASHFFNTNRNEEFTDEHLTHFFLFVKNNTQNNRFYGDVIFLKFLTSRKNDFADMLIQDRTLKVNEDIFSFSHIAFSYISEYGKGKFKDVIKEYIKQNLTSTYQYVSVVNRLKRYNLFEPEFELTKTECTDLIRKTFESGEFFEHSVSYAIDFIEFTKMFTIQELFNDTYIIDSLPNYILYYLKSDLNNTLSQLRKKSQMSAEDFDHTYLGEKIKNSTPLNHF